MKILEKYKKLIEFLLMKIIYFFLIKNGDEIVIVLKDEIMKKVIEFCDVF